MSTLDVIKYISIRWEGVLRVFNLPVAQKEIDPLQTYWYQLKDMKYTPFLRKMLHNGTKVCALACSVHTVFGDSHKDCSFQWQAYNLDYTKSFKKLREENLLSAIAKIQTPCKMIYRNTYFNSIGSDQRFRNMEI